LSEIDKSWRLIKTNMVEVDLWSSLYEWSEYVVKIENWKCKIFALDMLYMNQIKDFENL
jgi:23S rRNA U2552 (ribose-2'-O)-methylase RlmE/FtsJ